MVVSCSAINCRERHKKDGPHTFHRFPQELSKRKAWLKAMNREDFFPSKSSRICSRHFTPESFFQSSHGKHKLKVNAIPTIFDAEPIKKPRKVRSDKKILNKCKLQVNGIKKSARLTNKVTVKEEPIDDENAESDCDSFILPCSKKFTSSTKEVTVVVKEELVHNENFYESDSDSFILPCSKYSAGYEDEMIRTLKKEPIDEDFSEKIFFDFNAESQKKYNESYSDSFKLPPSIAAQFKRFNELNEVLKKKTEIYESAIKSIMECCCKCKCHDILGDFKITELLQQPQLSHQQQSWQAQEIT